MLGVACHNDNDIINGEILFEIRLNFYMFELQQKDMGYQPKLDAKVELERLLKLNNYGFGTSYSDVFRVLEANYPKMSSSFFDQVYDAMREGVKDGTIVVTGSTVDKSGEIEDRKRAILSLNGVEPHIPEFFDLFGQDLSNQISLHNFVVDYMQQKPDGSDLDWNQLEIALTEIEDLREDGVLVDYNLTLLISDHIRSKVLGDKYYPNFQSTQLTAPLPPVVVHQPFAQQQNEGEQRPSVNENRQTVTFGNREPETATSVEWRQPETVTGVEWRQPEEVGLEEEGEEGGQFEPFETEDDEESEEERLPIRRRGRTQLPSGYTTVYVPIPEARQQFSYGPLSSRQLSYPLPSSSSVTTPEQTSFSSPSLTAPERQIPRRRASSHSFMTTTRSRSDTHRETRDEDQFENY
jgi:hypothetical protein